jgi:AcrR family transcriptional regulator
VAKSGPKPRAAGQRLEDAQDTRRALITAAAEALREHGFAQASAREIGRRAGCNQALVFYHFGSVVNLHLAALDYVSEQRNARYQAAVRSAEGDLGALVQAARSVLAEDLDQGHVAVLATMIAAAQSTPELGPKVAERIAPWRQFAAQSLREALDGVPFARLLPADDLAHGVVALYLGLEMLASLDGDREPAARLFDHADRIASRIPRLLGGRRRKGPRAGRTGKSATREDT